MGMPVSVSYREADLDSHPPVNPATGRPYDSVLYVKTDSKGTQYKRAAIYDSGQVYVEYGIQYARVPQQQQALGMGGMGGMGMY